jgi:signal transduction histidine kinase
MLSRYGLRARMAASYVLVSVAAVLIVEVVLLTLVAPAIRSASHRVDQANERAVQATRSAAQVKASYAAAEEAGKFSKVVTKLAGERPNDTDAALLAAVAARAFHASKLGTGSQPETAPVVELLTGRDHRVVATSSEQAVARGSVIPVTAEAANWGSSPVVVSGSGTVADRVIGLVLVTVPDQKLVDEAVSPGGEKSTDEPVLDRDQAKAADAPGTAAADDIDVNRALLLPGLVVIALLVPMGVLLGLLSTGRPIKRIERLADGTARMAGGDLASRVPVSGGDEIGKLEKGFNAMAQRLDAAVQVERDAAGAQARVTERTRIARELHDSVSQHLFSLNLLAGGLRRALPPGSELHRQTESMERTVDRTMREMRAMLLELRPVGLEDAGLTAALEELCRTYEVRLGIRISAEVEDVCLDPPAEHAVLRVVQEAMTNAARHGDADLIELRVTQGEGNVTVAIRDQGKGFDPANIGERHGLGLELMRERVTELGGTVDVTSAPADGTTVRVRLPAGVS